MATATLFMHHSGPLTVRLAVNGGTLTSVQDFGRQGAALMGYVLAAVRALGIDTKERQWALLEFSPEKGVLGAAKVAG